MTKQNNDHTQIMVKYNFVAALRCLFARLKATTISLNIFQGSTLFIDQSASHKEY